MRDFLIRNMFHPLNKVHLNVFKDTQWRVLILCIAVLMFIFFLGMIKIYPWKEAIYKSFFQTVSAQSTSGFSTMDFAQAPALSKLSAIFSIVPTKQCRFGNTALSCFVTT